MIRHNRKVNATQIFIISPSWFPLYTSFWSLPLVHIVHCPLSKHLFYITKSNPSVQSHSFLIYSRGLTIVYLSWCKSGKAILCQAPSCFVRGRLVCFVERKCSSNPNCFTTSNDLSLFPNRFPITITRWNLDPIMLITRHFSSLLAKEIPLLLLLIPWKKKKKNTHYSFSIMDLESTPKHHNTMQICCKVTNFDRPIGPKS